MRGKFGLLLACCLVLGGRAAAGEAEDVVDKAIRAHGGADKLARVKQMQRSDTGTLSLGGGAAPFKDELIVDLPQRYRLDLVFGPQKTNITVVVNPAGGWQVTGGGAAELGKERLHEQREEMYVLYVQTLVPLRKERGFTLTSLPDAKVQGRKAAGVKVVSKGHIDVRLYFDKDSGKLVKVSRTLPVAGLSLEKDTLLSDYKRFGGVELPTRIVEYDNGSKTAEIKSATYSFPRITEKMFARP